MLTVAAVAVGTPSAAGAWDGRLERVSVSTAGGQGDGHSTDQAISGDGRYVVFQSAATNLVRGDTNETDDVFLRDRRTGTTRRVNVTPSGGQSADAGGSPSIDASGRYAAFASIATDLVAGDTNDTTDVFARDLWTGITTRVSVSSTGGQAVGGLSYRPRISPDGRYVAFESQATNLVAGDTNGYQDVFVHDRWTGVTTRVSVPGAAGADNDSFAPSISRGGRYVAFGSMASNLVPGDTNAVGDAFVRDLWTKTTTRVSVSSSGEETERHTSESTPTAISADGRYVVFGSGAPNLVPGDTNTAVDIFVRDRRAGTTVRVNLSTGGAEANSRSAFGSISADGRRVAFESLATNLVPGDANAHTDIFVRDLRAGTTTAVSVVTAGADIEDSTVPTISADGRHVAFSSWAPYLVPDDTNEKIDVFVGPARGAGPRRASG